MIRGSIVGTFTGNTYTANTTFTLVINPENTEAPKFGSTPFDQTVEAGKIL